jgi:SAM-dependent methyltransferase
MRKESEAENASHRVEEVVHALEDWYLQPQGQSLWGQFDSQLEILLPRIFGYHVLWLGLIPEGTDPMTYSRIHHHCHICPGQKKADVRSSLEVLPLQAESVDLVVVMHALELTPDPHQLLRELDRVLVPEGEVLIVHFNPVSWYGLWRMLFRWRGVLPWCLPFYTGFRIRDWLSLLGYDVVGGKGWGFTPPFQRKGVYQRLAWYERFSGRYLRLFNGLSLIHAKKRVATLTPIRHRWQPGRSLMGNGKLAEPTSRENGLVRNKTK